jgi:hypothetical protein
MNDEELKDKLEILLTDLKEEVLFIQEHLDNCNINRVSIQVSGEQIEELGRLISRHSK